jgi:transcriptional regulator of acetoin/glycerol metabolism
LNTYPTVNNKEVFTGVEPGIIIKTLQQNHGAVRITARQLGISPATPHQLAQTGRYR